MASARRWCTSADLRVGGIAAKARKRFARSATPDGVSSAALKNPKTPTEALSKIVAEMNERFGDGLAEQDRLVIDQYESAFRAHVGVVSAALANATWTTSSRSWFGPIFLDTIITQMSANERIFKLILADDRVQVLFRGSIA
jgi:hypothetical protein